MALKYPDILEHNNSAYALMNATELRGTSYPITNLADTGSIPTDKRALGAIVFVSSTQAFYGYYGQTTSSVDWSTAGNWRALASGISSLAGYITTGSASATQAITGSLTLSGSFKLDLPSKANNYVLTSDANGNATWASAQQASSIGFVTTGSSTATQAITGSLIISGSGLTVTGSLRVSGSTFINLGTSASVTNVVMINPTTGQLYYTASSAIQTSVVGYVTTSSFNSFTSSVVTTSSFNAFTSSAVTTSSFNAFTGSVTTTSSFNAFTSSVVTTSSFNSFTGSVTTTSSFNNFTSSVVTTSSFNSFTSSVVTTSSFNSFTGSVVTTSSFNSFTSSVVTTSSFNSYTASVSLQAVTNVGSSSTKDIAVDSVYIKPGAGYLTDWAAALTYLGDGSSAAGRLRLRESSTGNGKVATLTVGDLNDNRIINLPNAPGTLLITINGQEGDGNGNINLTGVGQTYYAGPGISIGTNNFISASVRTVNGVGPTNGNISTTLTAVTTGVSQSLFLSSSGTITGSLPNGLVWIISGDPVSANNGDVYIFAASGSTPGVSTGSWYPISPLDTAAADARYLKLNADNDPMTGELNMGNNSIVNIQKLGIGTQTPTATLQVIDSSSFVYQQTPTAGVMIGRQGSGSTFLVHTPSLNTTYGSGFVITGSYAGTKADVVLNAFGPYSAGGYNADMIFKTSYETGLTEVLRLSTSESIPRIIASGSLLMSGSLLRFNIPSKQANYVLTSDANGNATWAAPSVPSAVGFITTGSTSAYQSITGSLNVSSSLYINTALLTQQENLNVNTSGYKTIVSVATGSARAAFFDFVMYSGSANLRAGTVMSVWTGSTIEYTEASTNDIGTTSGVLLVPSISGQNILLQASASSNSWTIKSLVRLL